MPSTYRTVFFPLARSSARRSSRARCPFLVPAGNAALPVRQCTRLNAKPCGGIPLPRPRGCLARFEPALGVLAGLKPSSRQRASRWVTAAMVRRPRRVTSAQQSRMTSLPAVSRQTAPQAAASRCGSSVLPKAFAPPGTERQHRGRDCAGQIDPGRLGCRAGAAPRSLTSSPAAQYCRGARQPRLGSASAPGHCARVGVAGLQNVERGSGSYRRRSGSDGSGTSRGHSQGIAGVCPLICSPSANLPTINY